MLNTGANLAQNVGRAVVDVIGINSYHARLKS